jgi:hypothetical protein
MKQGWGAKQSAYESMQIREFPRLYVTGLHFLYSLLQTSNINMYVIKLLYVEGMVLFTATLALTTESRYISNAYKIKIE